MCVRARQTVYNRRDHRCNCRSILYFSCIYFECVLKMLLWKRWHSLVYIYLGYRWFFLLILFCYLELLALARCWGMNFFMSIVHLFFSNQNKNKNQNGQKKITKTKAEQETTTTTTKQQQTTESNHHHHHTYQRRTVQIDMEGVPVHLANACLPL